VKVTTKLTKAELAERLDDVLDRTSRGEEFIIERDGEPIAVIRTPEPGERPSITRREFLYQYRDFPRPDDRFADDLEAIQAEQNVVPYGAEIRGTTTAQGATLRELALRLAQLPPLDAHFAADIEAVRANQRPAKVPEWPD
jgi:antitoxin (DNA-binding transcriptional repressor) of toxin-antitoxin stability system